MSNKDMKTIREYIENKYFAIFQPDQRPYVWSDDEEVVILLDDIYNRGLNADVKNYYLGDTYFFKNDETDRLDIVDGQQRLITIMLIISSIAKKLKKFSDAEVDDKKSKELKDFVTYYKTYIYDKRASLNGRKLENKYRLVLPNTTTQTIFKKLLDGNGVDLIIDNKVSFEERKLILANKKINWYFDDHFDNPDDLKNYINYLLHNVTILPVELVNREDAHQIMVSKNDRGIPHGIDDKVRLSLLERVAQPDKKIQIGEYWRQFTSNLTDKGKYIVKIPNFIRHVIMSHGYSIHVEELRDWIDDNKKSEDDLFDFIRDLVECSKLYQNFHNNKDDKGTFNKSIESMNTFGSKQGYIILLAAYRVFGNDKSKIKEICKELERVIITYSLADKDHNKFKAQFPPIAKLIEESANDPNKYQEAINELQLLWKSQYNIALERLSIIKLKHNNRRQFMYILNKMAERLDGGGGANFEFCDIEHIMPKTKNNTWSHIQKDGEEYVDLISTFGNLTLMTSSKNRSLQEDSFENKQKIYINDSCPLTKSLVNPLVKTSMKGSTIGDKAISKFDYSPPSGEWTEDEITRRGKHLVNLFEYVFYGE